MFTRRRILALVILAVLGATAFLLFRPDKLFVDDPVGESLAQAFPSTTSAPAATSTTATGAPAGTAPATTSSASAAPVSTAPASTSPVITNPPPNASTTSAAAPTPISTGAFSGIAHSAVGTATVYEQDGRYVLRFEDDTDIQNGPDLYVWVLADADYDGGTPASYLDLGKLKGNVGGQNYELPAEFDPSVHRAVLIWCLRFAVPFATASLI